MLSAHAFNYENAKILLLGKYLTHSLTRHFETVQNSKKLQTTTEMWLFKDFKGGPSDLGTKILQKILKNHLYTPKAI